ncbi:hypothetical protein [Patiriisocius sp. Uisw_047]|jgi:hypothetical protein|uniref:hypothetical protein n=1 Tax=Patiriisocius sp. Uisw_047 TaxID=3230969 RepID=UPI0039ED2748
MAGTDIYFSIAPLKEEIKGPLIRYRIERLQYDMASGLTQKFHIVLQKLKAGKDNKFLSLCLVETLLKTLSLKLFFLPPKPS